MLNKLTGFQIINDNVGKKIAYNYSKIDDEGNIIKSNARGSFVVVDENLIVAINEIEKNINDRLEEL